jgi:hypothetical protein
MLKESREFAVKGNMIDMAVGIILARLDAAEQELRQIEIPLGYSDAHYHLRLHFDMVRAKVMAAKDISSSPARRPARRNVDLRGRPLVS